MTLADLPTLNATLNGISALLLAAGYVCIRRGDRRRHRLAMLAACTTSALFLVSYVIYHANVGSVPYEGEGVLRTAYFTILISHIILAVAIVPMVLMTLSRALSARFDRHRRIARLTLPLWLYVSVTGVTIYVMLYLL